MKQAKLIKCRRIGKTTKRQREKKIQPRKIFIISYNVVSIFPSSNLPGVDIIEKPGLVLRIHRCTG